MAAQGEREPVHCKKGLAVFPSQARMSLTKLPLAGNILPTPSPRKVWSKQIQESCKFVYNVDGLGKIVPLHLNMLELVQ